MVDLDFAHFFGSVDLQASNFVVPLPLNLDQAPAVITATRTVETS